MRVSDRIFSSQADNAMRITFHSWFGVGPGEEVDLSPGEIVAALIRAREYTRCHDARREINRIEKLLFKSIYHPSPKESQPCLFTKKPMTTCAKS
jgi:hypothetical protein